MRVGMCMCVSYCFGSFLYCFISDCCYCICYLLRIVLPMCFRLSTKNTLHVSVRIYMLSNDVMCKEKIK